MSLSNPSSNLTRILIIANILLALLIAGIVWKLKFSDSSTAENVSPAATIASKAVPTKAEKVKTALTSSHIVQPSTQDLDAKRDSQLAAQKEAKKKAEDDAQLVAEKNAERNAERKAKNDAQLAVLQAELTKARAEAEAAQLNLKAQKDEIIAAQQDLKRQKEKSNLLQQKMANDLQAEKVRVTKLATAQSESEEKSRLMIEQLRQEMIQRTQAKAIPTVTTTNTSTVETALTSTASNIATGNAIPKVNLSALEETIRKAPKSVKKYIDSLESEANTQVTKQTNTKQADTAPTTAEVKLAVKPKKAANVDYFNRVVISAKPVDTGSIAQSLAQKASTLMVARQDKLNKPSTDDDNVSTDTKVITDNSNTDVSSADNTNDNNTTFAAAVAEEAEVRESASRFITVREGDTLWIIAQRAYDDGGQYLRIFDANPQLGTDPNLIFPGQRLRVPN